MRRILGLLLLVAAACELTLAQDPSIDELRRKFDYELNAPLDVQEVGVINRIGVQIHDITYASPKNGRVTAYLVEPTRRGRFAGIVFGHWHRHWNGIPSGRRSSMHEPALFRFWWTI